MTTILGIDPGLSGAFAWLDDSGRLAIEDMPVFEIKRNGKSKRQVNLQALVALTRREPVLSCELEAVSAMPHQGVTSMFSFGRTLGQIEAAIAAAGIPISYASPVVWKKALRVPAGKDGARARASQLLPAYAHLWPLVKHDGRAEAALIALFAMQRQSSLRMAA